MESPAEYVPPFSLDRLKKMVSIYRDVTMENADKCRKDRDYFDNVQLSPEVLAELSARKQPPIFTNKIAPAINGMLGLLDGAQSDPEAIPRTSAASDAADVVTKTLRYIADKTNYKRVRQRVSENFLIEGTGAAIIRYETRKREICADRIHWDEFIYDPESREHDFSDARYLGVAKMRDQDEVLAEYGEAYERLGAPWGDSTDFFGDDLKKRWWSDPARKRVRTIDLYYVAADGEWHRCIFVSTGVIWAGQSPYQDDEGSSICPIIGVSYEVARDGSRYSPIRAMQPLQDEVNMRRSRLLHHVNSRQVQQTDLMAPPVNKDIAKREAAKADGAIPYGWEVKPAPDLAQGQMLLLQKTESDLDRLAPTPAVLGRNGVNESGRARQILQEAGTTEQKRAFSRFEAFELRAYRLMWFLARQFYDEQMEIRITADPRAPEFLKINEPVMGPTTAPAIHPATGQPMVDPMGQPMMVSTIGPVGMRNQLAQLDMDITITTVPDQVSLQHEVFAQVLEWATGLKMDPFDPRFHAMIEMSTIPDKRATIEKLKRLASEAQQESAPQQEAAQQAQQAQMQSDLQLNAAKAAQHSAQAEKLKVEALHTLHLPFPSAGPRAA